MSRKRKQTAGPAHPQEAAATPGAEVPSSSGEGGDGKLPLDPELLAALREAEESVATAKAQKGEDAGPIPEADAAEADAAAVEAEPSEAGAEAGADERESLSREFEEEKDRRLRLQADFENFRKRTDREKLESLYFGPQNLVKDLLSVVDNLERAIAHARESEGEDLQGLLQGVELVERELQGVLGKHHVSEVEARGKPFDPAVHEAMAQVVVEGEEPNTVIEVLQKGYQLRDRLVRPARVVVTKAAEPSEPDPAEAQESVD